MSGRRVYIGRATRYANPDAKETPPMNTAHKLPLTPGSTLSLVSLSSVPAFEPKRFAAITPDAGGYLVRTYVGGKCVKSDWKADHAEAWTHARAMRAGGAL